jgi:hypothetical protein
MVMFCIIFLVTGVPEDRASSELGMARLVLPADRFKNIPLRSISAPIELDFAPPNTISRDGGSEDLPGQHDCPGQHRSCKVSKFLHLLIYLQAATTPTLRGIWKASNLAVRY